MSPILQANPLVSADGPAASTSMSILILIPAIVCALALYRWTPARLFRKIVRPVLLRLPIYYYCDHWKTALLSAGVQPT